MSAPDFPPRMRERLRELGPGELALVNRGHCPVCLERGFVLGPRGGHSINIECANTSCRQRFNIAAAWRSHAAVFGQMIPRQEDGGGSWGSEPR